MIFSDSTKWPTYCGLVNVYSVDDGSVVVLRAPGMDSYDLQGTTWLSPDEAEELESLLVECVRRAREAADARRN